MKRYDIPNAEQFGRKQFWVCKFDSYDVWVSYNTAVAIVDKPANKVILGKCAYGFSRTTSKQVSQACYQLTNKAKICNVDSPEYQELEERYPRLTDVWGNTWDKYNHGSRTAWNFWHICDEEK